LPAKSGTTWHCKYATPQALPLNRQKRKTQNCSAAPAAVTLGSEASSGPFSDYS